MKIRAKQIIISDDNNCCYCHGVFTVIKIGRLLGFDKRTNYVLASPEKPGKDLIFLVQFNRGGISKTEDLLMVGDGNRYYVSDEDGNMWRVAFCSLDQYGLFQFEHGEKFTFVIDGTDKIGWNLQRYEYDAIQRCIKDWCADDQNEENTAEEG